MKNIGLKTLINSILILIIVTILCVILNFIGKIFFVETLSKIPNLFYQYINSIKLTFILNTSVILLTVIFGFLISIYFFVNKKNTILKYFIPYPHISFAIGILFFFSTSGLLNRFLNFYNKSEIPLIDYMSNNEYSILYIISLTMRELPFFILVSIMILNKINFLFLQKHSENLKLKKFNFYLSVIFPLWIKRMLLPILIIISFSYSNYEYSFILGTQFPELLNQELVNIWKNEFHYNTQNYNVLSLFITICFIFTYLFIYLIFQINRYLSIHNVYRKLNINLILIGKYLYLFLIFIFVSNFIVLLINSLSTNWFFPNIIPSGFTINNFLEIFDNNLNLIINSIIISIFLSILSIVIFLTYFQLKIKLTSNYFEYVLFISVLLILIIPQNIFLINLNIIFNYLPIDSELFFYLFSLIIFIFPYTYFMLKEKFSSELYKSLYIQKENLKLSNYKFLKNIIYPIYKDTIIFITLIGFSVCYYQFLQSIFIGSGNQRLFNNEVMVLFSGESAQLSSAAAIINLLPCLVLFKYFKFNNVKV